MDKEKNCEKCFYNRVWLGWTSPRVALVCELCHKSKDKVYYTEREDCKENNNERN